MLMGLVFQYTGVISKKVILTSSTVSIFTFDVPIYLPIICENINNLNTM